MTRLGDENNSLRREQTELQEQVEQLTAQLEKLAESSSGTVLPDLEEVRDRILKSLKVGIQSPLYKRVKAELEQLFPPNQK